MERHEGAPKEEPSAIFLRAWTDYAAEDYWWRPLRDHPRFQALLEEYE